MELTVYECKMNNQYYWAFSDMFSGEQISRGFLTKEQAIDYGIEKGWIKEKVLYPDYKIN